MSYYVSTPAKTLFENFFNNNCETKQASTPRVDVYSDETAYYLEVELPGFSKEAIAIEVKDGALSIKAQNKKEEEKKEWDYHIRERANKTYERSFKLGDTLEPDSVSASHANGVLTLTINKKEKALPKQVTIQ